jgi:hypothetical protein
MARTRGNNGIIGRAVKPGTSGIIAATDAAEASLGGSWPGSTSQNVIYISGTGGSGYAVTTTVTGIAVTNNVYTNTPSALIGYSNSFVKVFGAGFIANTAVVVNANTVPQSNVIYISDSELRVALPFIANLQSIIFNVVNPSDNNIIVNEPSYPIGFLVVGGGGSGGWGRGAGGGGGGMTFGNTAIIAGISYPIIVGSGGIARTGVCCGRAGAPGSPSQFHVFTVGAGGGGGSGQPKGCASGVGLTCGYPGTSGGGAGGRVNVPGSAGSAGLAIGSPAQGVAGTYGYPGGTGTFSPGSIFNSGGGGGAGAAGTNATPTSAGPGGIGLRWPYNRTYYAGGGGGASARFSPPYCAGKGFGGCGGGGNAGGTGSGITGTCGLGGGGGGGGNQCGSPGQNSGGGGSGTVILAIPTPVYPSVSAPGASVSTSPFAPGYTLLTYITPQSANTTYTFRA